MESESDVVKELMEVIETLGSFVSYRRTQRKECLNLVRRLKLLVPLLEELRDQQLHPPISDEALNCLANLKKALCYAKKLLGTCSHGSKIYLAFESEAVMSRFHGLYDKLNQALDDMPYEKLGISEEVKEQVELMCMQLKRAKRRTDTQDIELAMDMMVVFSENDDRNADNAILERLAIKLELHTIADLKTETIAVRKLVNKKGAHNVESTKKIVDLLEKFKHIVGIEEISVLDNSVSRSLEKCRSLLIPHEFLCPITLEIMTDPVIVATGQTYERESIQKWLNSNHRTCPKTGQSLAHVSLAPNFALRNLILQWCENNNFELPRKDIYDRSDNSSIALIEEISSLVQNLSSRELDIQREAIVKIRMLSKENPNNRILLANMGAIPPLIKFLSYPDSKIQEHTVTTLLNLSLDEVNKRLIAREGAIPTIIEILQNGTDEARENSAATLFSMSMLNENKVMIGCLNGIPPLVDLLRTGTVRGKKDAATALFNLSLNILNKSRAIKAGIVPPLLHLLEDKNLGMVDEALDDTFQSNNCSEVVQQGSAVWDIFRRQDVPKLIEYLKKHWKEFRHINNRPVTSVVHPIHDQTFYLNEKHKKQLKEEFNIEPWTFEQYLGEAVFIPAGCPHQVRNRQSCIKVALDFVSPDNVQECIRLTEEFRLLPKTHRSKEDKLEVKKLALYAASVAVSEAKNLMLKLDLTNTVGQDESQGKPTFVTEGSNYRYSHN